MATKSATPSRTRSTKKAAKSVAAEVLPAENVDSPDLGVDFKRAQLNHAFAIATLRQDVDRIMAQLGSGASETPAPAAKTGRVPKKAAK